MSQGPKTKTTSLEKLIAALTEAGWTFEAVEKPVWVPDPEAVESRTYSGRARYVPKKQVPGVVVKATNGVEGNWYGDNSSFTAQFTESGKFLEVTGGYPFNIKGYTLTKTLEQIERKAPARIAARQTEQEQRKAQDLAEYDAKVEAAYAEAQKALTFAKGTSVQNLMRDQGLTQAQAEQVVESIISGGFGPVLNAATQVKRTAQGWIGETYTPATYVDGKRVAGTES